MKSWEGKPWGNNGSKSQRERRLRKLSPPFKVNKEKVEPPFPNSPKYPYPPNLHSLMALRIINNGNYPQHNRIPAIRNRTQNPPSHRLGMGEGHP